MLVDKHELTVLEHDLRHAGDELIDDVYDITEDTIVTMERSAARAVRGFTHLPWLPRSFTHDVTKRGHEVRGETGADWSLLQGRLDVYIEYGTPTSHPHPHWAPAHERYTPVWVDRLEEACADAVEHRGPR